MTRADDNAFEGIIERDAALVGKVFNTRVPDGTKTPYVVYFPTLSPDIADRQTGPQVSREPSYTVHAVGNTADQAQWANERVDAQLRPGGRNILVPVVTGRRNGTIRRTVNAGINTDTDASPEYIYAVSEYSWGSDPA